MASDILFQLTLVIASSAIIAAVFYFLKQPLLVSYIITGALLGVYADGVFSSSTIESFAHIGIALLLFLIGLNLDIKKIKDFGKVSFLVGLGQVLFTASIGYVISQFLGFTSTESIYIAIALTFSSTIIIVKLLSDRGEMDSLHGKIAVGALLFQDMVAVIILIVVSSLYSGAGSGGAWLTVATGLGFSVAVLVVGLFIMPRVAKLMASSQELLFIFSLAWALTLSYGMLYLGFSMEIGALIAGVTLAASPYHFEIGSRIRPLRDFFIVLFFVYLGSQMVGTGAAGAGFVVSFIPSVVAFSLFVLVGNPLIVMALMGLMGYKRRTGFMSGLTVAQISEFSLILILLGVSVGQLSSSIVSIITAVAMITFFASTYMIRYSDRLFDVFSKYLKVFERTEVVEAQLTSRRSNVGAVLFGCDRMGYSVLDALKSITKKILVVDLDPNAVGTLSELGFESVYGDASDVELLGELDISKVPLVVSTVPNFDSNMMILREVRKKNKKSVVMVTAHTIDDSKRLYKAGANYVIMPGFLGGDYMAHLIRKGKFNASKYKNERSRQARNIVGRKELGNGHSDV